MTAVFWVQRRDWVRSLAVCIALALLPCAMVGAQTASSQTASSSSEKTGRKAVNVSTAGPAWADLTVTEQQALQPLATSWDRSISAPQKRKWLQISKNYSSLSPSQQAALNKRMNVWVAMSPQQRAQARLNYGKTQELSQLTPEEKKAKWQSYQALSQEEKQKLAAKAVPNPKGAATATQPVAAQKLVPLRRRDSFKPSCAPAQTAANGPVASSPPCAAAAMPAKLASSARSASSAPKKE